MSDTIKQPDIVDLNKRIIALETQIKPISDIIGSYKELGRDTKSIESSFRVLNSMLSALKTERDILLEG